MLSGFVAELMVRETWGGEMEGLVIGAVGAVVGGALVFGTWSLLPDAWQASRAPVAVVAAVLCGLSASRIELPSLQTPAAVERTLLAHPDLGELMSAWKETDPSAFADFVALAAEQEDADFVEARNDPRFSDGHCRGSPLGLSVR
jgi:uncharacterized membrane protein YeaQ/YmgE (transglycosylase-associated protein family)